MKLPLQVTFFSYNAMLLYVDGVPVVSTCASVPFCCDAASLECALRYLSDAGSVMRVMPDSLKAVPRSTGLRTNFVIVPYAKNL